MWQLSVWIALVACSCVYWGPQYAEAVPNKSATVANETDYLKFHNEYRQMVFLGKVPNQPKALVMPDLQWSDYLAQLAKNWSEHCTFHHDTNPNFGENMAMATYTAYNPVKAWFEEHKDYSFVPMGAGYEAYGHYTQLVWAESHYVGCFRNFCPKLKMDNETVDDAYLYVCKYYPAGNFVGQYPYQVASK